ncbi:hypothetical protein R3I93_019766 [Phoxinus phoxinus]|uniref:Uncharacterized protein n=1 Tax=Phoxinus phoxinus TaxID=58324 RepID=A0AAN9GWQ2_9TELE
MHMLVIMIFMTAAYQHNTIARASGFCGLWNKTHNAVLIIGKYTVNTKMRIQCAEGYARKAGTSNLISCKDNNGNISWHTTNLPLECIPDPKNPPVRRETTTSTTERTEIKNPTVLGTSMPTTGVTVCVNNSSVSEGNAEATFSDYASTVVGVTSVMFICLAAAAVFLIWWRLRHRERDMPEASYTPVQLVHMNIDQLN